MIPYLVSAKCRQETSHVLTFSQLATIMKNDFLFIIILFFSVPLISQDYYENGFYINPELDTIHVLIKNEDWLSNPKGITIKETNTSKAEFLSTNNFIQFQIPDKVKYIKRTLNVDLQKHILSNLSTNRNPNFIEREILLKVLIQGKASIYSYVDGNNQIFFFQINNEPINQLIYKPFQKEAGIVEYNNYYRQQLLNSLDCDELEISDFKKLKYTSADLVSIVKVYNASYNSAIVDFSSASNQSVLNFYLVGGLRLAQFSISNVLSSMKDNSFNSKFVGTIGLKLEGVLPFRNGNWSIFLEPTYHKYETTDVIENQFLGNNTINVRNNSVEIPLGLKYNVINRKAFKYYISTTVVPEVHINSEINFSKGSSLYPHRNFGFGIGTGITINRAQLEFVYHSRRDILNNYFLWNGYYKNVSLRFRYNIITTDKNT